jgi:hypothetical protein
VNRVRAGWRWWGPAAAGLLLVSVFTALVVVSATIRQYWPLLILSACVTGLPVLLRAPSVPAAQPLTTRVAPSGVGEPSTAAALIASAVSIPKAGAAPEEIEDAYGIDAVHGYVAVADGASTSFRAADWARTLCETFLDRRPLDGMPSQTWITGASATFDRPEPDDPDWWAVEAANRGAHAAFVGLAVVRHEPGLAWRATAVGDCILVHLREATDGPVPTVVFPIAHSAAFPAAPMLLSTAADGPPPCTTWSDRPRWVTPGC